MWVPNVFSCFCFCFFSSAINTYTHAHKQIEHSMGRGDIGNLTLNIYRIVGIILVDYSRTKEWNKTHVYTNKRIQRVHIEKRPNELIRWTGKPLNYERVWEKSANLPTHKNENEIQRASYILQMLDQQTQIHTLTIAEKSLHRNWTIHRDLNHHFYRNKIN